MKIKVVGPGCKNCQTLYNMTQDIIKDIPEDIEVEHVTDIQEMFAHGVQRSPGLVIDGKVVSQGKRLKAKEISKIISEYK